MPYFRRKRRKSKSVLVVILLLPAAVLAGAAILRSLERAELRRTRETRHIEANSAENRPIYRHSVVKGGVFSREEALHAVQSDPVVARHYAPVRLSGLEARKNDRNRSVFVSYRRGSDVFWTSRRVRVPAEEVVVTDGKSEIRARCGNRISETPQWPVSANEPPEHELDQVSGGDSSIAANERSPEGEPYHHSAALRRPGGPPPQTHLIAHTGEADGIAGLLPGTSFSGLPIPGLKGENRAPWPIVLEPEHPKILDPILWIEPPGWGIPNGPPPVFYLPPPLVPPTWIDSIVGPPTPPGTEKPGNPRGEDPARRPDPPRRKEDGAQDVIVVPPPGYEDWPIGPIPPQIEDWPNGSPQSIDLPPSGEQNPPAIIPEPGTWFGTAFVCLLLAIIRRRARNGQ